MQYVVHHEPPDASRPHNWTALYNALDLLTTGTILAIHLGRNGCLFVGKTRQAVYRHGHTLPAHVAYATQHDGSVLYVRKVKA